MLDVMPKVVPIPEHLRATSFTLETAHAFGVTSGRLRGPDIAHPFHGVNAVHQIADDVESLARAYMPRLAVGQYFSHVTAARILEAPLPQSCDTRTLDITVAWPRTPPRTRNVRGHSSRPGLVSTTIHHGLPIVAAADIWCQLASVLTREDLVAVGDYLLSGNVWHGNARAPFATIDDMVASVQRHARSRGATRARWALPLIRTKVDARPESLLRLLFRSAGLPEPLIGDPTPVAGGLILHPDLKLERWRVVFEYEGELHFTDPRQARLDINRRRMLEAAGWTVVRVTSDDVFVHPDRFIREVRAILASRG